jgi:hypothetical protein
MILCPEMNYMTVICLPGDGMPPAAVPVTLTASERKTLKKRVRGARTCWRDRLRAQIVLEAARGRPNARVAAGRDVAVGALALLAGLDVHNGQVFASTPGTTGIAPFMDLAGQVMDRPEYKNAPRVFVIVDNGSDHRGKKAAERIRAAHPNAVMIHTPAHASWLNQSGAGPPWRRRNSGPLLPSFRRGPARRPRARRLAGKRPRS